MNSNGTSIYRDINEFRLARLMKWIEALESGKYCQTWDALRDNLGFCAIGVAMDVHLDRLGDQGSAEWVPYKVLIGQGRSVKTYELSYSDEGDLLREDSELGRLRTMFGLSEDEEAEIIKLNDSRRWSFEDIAQYLRERVVPKLEHAIKVGR